MKALAVEEKQLMRLCETEVPQLKDTEVLVKVAYCGICGSDLPRFFDGAVHNFPPILGHEFSGMIVKTGKEVSEDRLGQRVIGAPLMVCGRCPSCRAGKPQLCEQYGFIGSHQPGAFAEYVAVPEENIIEVPDQVSFKEAALVEPFTVGLHAVERLPFRAGEAALILGAGAIGLAVVAALRARGAGKIYVVDMNEQRLEFAEKIGADVTLNPEKVKPEEYFSQNEKVGVIFETAGHPVTQVQAITLAGKGGKVIYVGTSHRDITFRPQEFEQIFRKELLITGNMMSYSAPFPGYEWKTALEYMERGNVNLKEMITGIYPLEAEAEPFWELRKKDSGHIKILYEIGGEEK